MMTIDEAVQLLREDAKYADLVRYSYLGTDTRDSAERFATSGEFSQVLQLLGNVRGKSVLDVGAGTGIASYAFTRAGVAYVYALEPDASDLVGRGAARRIIGDLPITLLDALADMIPLPDASVDLVYMRQVMHHIPDLRAAMRDIARVLKPGGQFLACREHVVDDEVQKQTFLQNHPMHQLTGSENAYRLDEYVDAIIDSGLMMRAVLRPWDTVITTFPLVQQPADLDQFFRLKLRERFGAAGVLAGYVPFVTRLVQAQYNRLRSPGRLYAFHAVKPS